MLPSSRGGGWTLFFAPSSLAISELGQGAHHVREEHAVQGLDPASVLPLLTHTRQGTDSF